MADLLFIGYEFVSACIPFTFLFVFIKKRKGEFISPFAPTNMLVFIFAIYLTGMLHFTGAGTIFDGFIYRLEFKPDQLNILPFSKDVDTLAYLYNVLLFIPLGFLVPLIWKRLSSFSKIALAGLSLSALIEISQLLNNRRTDIDDIIMNMLGAMTGYAIYRAWHKLTRGEFALVNKPSVELWICILIVFMGRFLFFNELAFAKMLYVFS